jgi:hypothetical protein
MEKKIKYVDLTGQVWSVSSWKKSVASHQMKFNKIHGHSAMVKVELMQINQKMVIKIVKGLF